MHRRGYAASILAAFALFFGLGPASPAQDPRATDPLAAPSGDSEPMAAPPLPTGMSREQLFGTTVRDSKWKRNPVEVCWLAMPADEADERALVRRAVAETWEKYSAARFSGWGLCAGNPRGIRIAVADQVEAPHVDYIGRFVDGRDPGMVLNFTFMNWRQQCQQSRDFCIYAIAAHEFGHALGFTHEQNREDAPDWCREKEDGAIGDYEVTKYDASSIMNYCNVNWNGNGRLSALDVMAVQTVYGRA